MSPKSPKFATESLPLFVLPLSIVYHYSQLKVYHYLYNNIELIQRNRFWYCFCDKTIVYEKNGQKSTACLVCWKWTKHLTLMSWKKLKSVL